MRELDQTLRNASLWTTARGRRDVIPRYSNSLSRVETRAHRCKTCGMAFSNVRNMERHVVLTHTGTKPVVCTVCDKRFHCRHHMTSHYPIHREPNLSQVEPFIRRRLGVSEPMTSQTSVGSIHGMSRRLKHYLSEPSYRTFGTSQSFDVSSSVRDSRYHDNLKSLRASFGTPRALDNGSDNETDIQGQRTLNTGKADQIPGVDLRCDVRKRDRIPGIDPGSIASIDSVMGPYRQIATSDKSGFLKSAEDRLINSRLDAVSLAGWTMSKSSSGERSIVSRGTT